ncbi:NAD(P)-dependent oxidoreductase [Rhizobium alvei]|uniref:NAD(P)-dependent oxidoreductase n=1 Tax=Rhizobium alvei TaxID=1132659 RepID=A0ABT8YN51_9HYPH|nr:NAD(P)-dependent oxidoreductase [Rhizobium alvei]MDO6965158.1 NAD(P)-dependent oxidoreductase [Rhizobium alvei]
MQTIAFLGTGLMGAPMVRNLLAAGYSVTVWNRSIEKALPLAEHGARIAETPAAAVSKADLIFTMVTDGAAVGALLEDHGVAGAAPKGAIVVDMSSIKPSEAEAHAALLESHGIDHLDAPVSGGTRGATEATLAIMAGGKAEVFARAEPVLRLLGRPVLVGPSGSGQRAKLANQAIVAATIGIVAEAMLLMAKGGADVDRFREALKGGFADSIILQQHGRRMAAGDYAPGGRSSLQLKDLNNLLEEATSLGLELPISALQQTRYDHLVHGMKGADLDHAALYLELEARQPKG